MTNPGDRFGQQSFSAPSPAQPAPDANEIQVEWWAIPAAGPPFVLPEVTDFAISDITGGRGSISIDTPLGTDLHELLLTHTVRADRDLEVQIRLFGGSNRALGGFLMESQADEVAESGKRRFSGHLMGQRLYEAVLYHDPADPEGKTRFVSANAGQIVQTLMAVARARGALTDITTHTFSTTTDSNGVAWPAVATLAFDPGALYGELLEELDTELGMCEWEVTGRRELKLYVPDGRGVDRTIGPSPVRLHRGRDLLQAPRKHSVRNSATTLFTAGKQGLFGDTTDPSALARRGRRIETYQSANQLVDAESLTAFRQAKLATLTGGAMELSHALVVGGPGPQPFLHVDSGDLVWSDTGSSTGPEKRRVAQVSLNRSGEQLTAAAVVGTLTSTAVQTLHRRLNRMQRGAAVVGTSVADPGATGEDTTAPAAPIGLVADSFAYQDVAGGPTLASVTVGWQPVTTNPGGPATDQARAALLILERMQSGEPIYEDWTYRDAPALVGQYNDPLLAAFHVAVPDAGGFPDNLPRAQEFLRGYVLANSSTAVATDDVAGYKIRYAYVGLNQIGGIPSSDPFADPNLAYYEATPPGGGTTATSYTFSGVGAGTDIRVQVAAFDNSGNVSLWSAPLTFTTAVDNTPPSITSTPQASTWFGSVRVTWDGLTVDGVEMRTAAGDFSHVEVHVSPVLDFTPDASTYQTTLAAAGTWPVNDLTYGVAWYARLVAVDTAGNRSDPSATSVPATPSQLVQIDIGPDAIGRQQVIDGEIVNAKIGNLAVNDAKMADVSIGKLITGTLFADVTLSGIIRTALTGARAEIDAAGIRLHNALGNLTVRLSAIDGSALITGTYQSGLVGERINILPDGTLRFYPVAGTNFSQIANAGNDVVWRGPLSADGRSGRFNVNTLGCGMNYSAEAEIPSNLRAEVAVFDRRVRLTSPNIHLQVNGKLPTADGSARRVMFSTTSSSGVDVGASFVQYVMASSGSGGFSGNGAGFKFEAGQLLVCGDDALNSFGVIKASDFAPASSRELKADIAPLQDSLGGRAVDTARRMQPVTFSYRATTAGPGRHIGLIAEDVALVAPDLVVGHDRPAPERAISVMGVATLALAAGQDNADDIAVLRARVDALQARLDAFAA